MMQLQHLAQIQEEIREILLIPGLQSSGADYRESDYDDLGAGKGRLLGDLSGFDWTEWTMDSLMVEFRIRYWGGVSRRNIRTVTVYRQYKIRVCQECGALLRTYDGVMDTTGSYIRYIRDDPVVVFADDFELVHNVFQRFKSMLYETDRTVVDLSRACPLTVCTLDLGLPTDNDLTMPDAFTEPDEYFLARQRRAFGQNTDDTAEAI